MTGGSHDPRKTFGAALTLEAELDERIVALSADSGGSSGLGAFRQRFPGSVPGVRDPGAGSHRRCRRSRLDGQDPRLLRDRPVRYLPQLRAVPNDLGYMNQNVKIVGRNGGFTYADLGSTHHSLEDYALMRMIPGVTVLAPQDAGEIRGAVHAMLQIKGPVYMQIATGPSPSSFPMTTS